VFALLVRLPGINARPVHPDEAVNAHLLDALLGGEGYRYRTHDHHGPTLYFLAAGVLELTGPKQMSQWEAWMLRLFPAVCGAVAAGGAAAWLATVSGARAGLAAGVLLGLTAPYVYYSGSFIHETLLVALLLGWLACAWRCATADSPGSAWLGGIFAGLMLATKETAAPVLLLLTLAIVIAARPPWRRVAGSLARAVPAALFVVVILFSGFLREPARSFDLFRAVGEQMARGTGEEHAYPFFTYIRWFLAPAGVGVPWGCWIALGLALAGAWTCRRNPLACALSLGAALAFLFFSALPYKTPWLVLAPGLPLVLVAALGAEHLLARLPGRALSAALVLILVSLAARETYVRCVHAPVDAGNPLAYSPGSPDLARLETDLARLVGSSGCAVQVVAEDYWPLPWTLRQHRAGFWPKPPARLLPGYLLTSADWVGEFSGRAKDFTPYQIRPGLTLFLARVP